MKTGMLNALELSSPFQRFISYNRENQASKSWFNTLNLNTLKTPAISNPLCLWQRVFPSTIATEPQFPGGREGINQYLKQNIPAHLSAHVKWGEDSVRIHFFVDKNGKVSQVETSGGPGPVCTAAIKQAIENMPAWRPGMRNGRRVTMPVTLGIECMFFLA